MSLLTSGARLGSNRGQIPPSPLHSNNTSGRLVVPSLLRHGDSCNCGTGIHATAARGFMQLRHGDSCNCSTGIHATAARGFIQLWHGDSYNCGTEIHTTVARGFLQLRDLTPRHMMPLISRPQSKHTARGIVSACE